MREFRVPPPGEHIAVISPLLGIMTLYPYMIQDYTIRLYNLAVIEATKVQSA